ncbi:ribosomal protein L17 [Lysinibacillus composti]|uniref:Uncharacterized protein n=1 Tax=Lysinibacillus composti TaxID=720633 RepID=A0A3N9UK71_9BACI|nr:hypothetical protein [Lysinibacillus composti]MBM7607049.1 ribosomal protein L17 [Lysinibacillus composti]RQW76354.1 hypothetical protein EBB45_02055 [Lysinibacillus composti]
MFFQVSSKQMVVPKEQEVTKDLYDQLQFIVTTLLQREIPSGNAMHQILFKANIQLEELRQSTAYHRKHISMNNKIGIFHKEAYELTLKQLNQLQLIIDSYISLNNEDDRKRLNRRLSLVDNQINELYLQVNEFTKVKTKTIRDIEEKFWKAVKEDLFPLLAEIR